MASPTENVHSPSAALSAAGVKEPALDDGIASSQQRSKPLSRQSSAQSLNLDEFQPSALESGKSLGSMNMDEFLLSIWSTEETRQAPDAPGQSGPLSGQSAAAVVQQSLCGQGAASLAREREKEEVVQKGNCEEEGGGNGGGEELCEGMTLEDFLMKAGVVPEGFGGSSPSGQGTAKCYESSGNGVARGGRNTGVESLVVGAAGMAAAVSPEGVVVDEAARGGGRKRMLESGRPVDQGAERRQRRMIKNRESAARSRARRQAYTMELEAELNQLKEENAQIKKETEELIDELKQKLMEPTHSKDNEGRSILGRGGKKLRRTSSSPI